MNLYLKLIFLLILFLHVALIKLTMVIPVRTIALFAFVGLLFLVYNRQFVNFIRRYTQILLIFAVMAFLGGFLAILQGTQLLILLENLLRNIIQPLLVLISVYLAVQIFGLTFVVNAILMFVAMNAVIAIFQFLGIELAWDIRRFFGNIQGSANLDTSGRPLGLLFTPMLFAYYLVNGYVVANLLYWNGFMQRRFYALFTIIVLFASVANSTRSLIFGILIHEGLRLVLHGGLRSFAWLAALAVVAVGGFYYLESTNSRIVSFDDASAVGRIVLLQFGLQLFLDNPFGYGWGVVPGEYAWLFMEKFSDMDRVFVIFRLGIHNAFINFVLVYGIIGIGVIFSLAARNMRNTLALIVAFTAYIINMLFHNAGVFVGELYFWFAFAIFLHLYESRDEALPSGVEGRSWTTETSQPVPVPDKAGDGNNSLESPVIK